MLGDAISVSVPLKRILSRIEVVNKTKLLEYFFTKKDYFSLCTSKLYLCSPHYKIYIKKKKKLGSNLRPKFVHEAPIKGCYTNDAL